VAKYLLKNVKNCQNLSNFIKTMQNGAIRVKKIQIVLYCRERRDRREKRIVFFEKTKPIAGLRLETRSSKLDNSGVFTGCLLPGVVPEIRNPKS
jgi:hypothetical protein